METLDLWFSPLIPCRRLFHRRSDPYEVRWFFFESLVSQSLYHYSTKAFFFNNRVNTERFKLRKASAISNNVDLGLRSVLSM